LPNTINNSTTEIRKDTLRAISYGLTGCEPDTAYMEVVVNNGVTLMNVTDKTACNGGSTPIVTSINGRGTFDGWTIISTATGGTYGTAMNSASTTLNTTFNPQVFPVTQITSRIDVIKYTATPDSSVCPIFIDSFKVTVNPAHFVEITPVPGMDPSNPDTLVICEGDTLTGITGFRQGGTTTTKWTSTNGTFSSPTNTIDTFSTDYIPNLGLTTNTRFDTYPQVLVIPYSGIYFMEQGILVIPPL